MVNSHLATKLVMIATDLGKSKPIQEAIAEVANAYSQKMREAQAKSREKYTGTGGFAALSKTNPKKMKEIASLGGQASGIPSTKDRKQDVLDNVDDNNNPSDSARNQRQERADDGRDGL